MTQCWNSMWWIILWNEICQLIVVSLWKVRLNRWIGWVSNKLCLVLFEVQNWSNNIF
jgi:hypothetical protein